MSINLLSVSQSILYMTCNMSRFKCGLIVLLMYSLNYTSMLLPYVEWRLPWICLNLTAVGLASKSAITLSSTL